MNQATDAPAENVPVISIITVVWNAANDLRTTIESVRQQDYPHREYVVVDGASTDGTVDVIRAAGDVVSKWVSKTDRGLYDAMNTGKGLATGDFLLFLNAGDTFVTSSVLSQMVERIDDPNTLYFGNVRLTDCTGSLQWEVPIRRHRNGPPPRSYLPHHQSILYPRRFITEENYDLSLGYRADAAYTNAAWAVCARCYIDVTLVDSTLGGMSSKAISSLSGLRGELREETAFARQAATTSRKWLPLLDVISNVLIKYVASKIGGLPLVHRLMYIRHHIKARLSR